MSPHGTDSHEFAIQPGRVRPAIYLRMRFQEPFRKWTDLLRTNRIDRIVRSFSLNRRSGQNCGYSIDLTRFIGFLAVQNVPMYIETAPNRNSRPAILLREGWREGRKVCKRTLANLTDWPPHKIEALRRVLKDEPLISASETFRIERSLPHGHVEAIMEMIHKIGLDRLISSRRTRNRDLVLAMIIERVIRLCSKLAARRWWHTTTLAETLAVGDAQEDELYAAMDWLLGQQSRIETHLATRFLAEGGQAVRCQQQLL
jgi:predicted transcriptional regulator